MSRLSIIKIIFTLFFAAPLPCFSGDIPLQKSWDYYYEKGKLQFENQMYDYAIENLTKAIEGNPKLARAATLTGDIYLLKNNKIRALDYYTLSLSIDESQPDVHFKIAALYDFFYELELAFAHYRSYAALDPENQHAHINLVRFYLSKNEKEKATEHFTKSFQAGEKKSGGFTKKIIARIDADDFSGAQSLYADLIALHPANMEAYLKISELLIRDEKYQEAAHYLERAKFLKPDYEPAYLHAGRLYLNGRFPGRRKLMIEKALKNFLKAAEINPKNAETFYNLSQVYLALKKDLKAKEMEKKGRELDRGE